MTTFEEYWKEHGTGLPEDRHYAEKIWTACFRSFSSFLEGGNQAKIALEYILLKHTEETCKCGTDLDFISELKEIDAYIRTVLPNIKKLMGDTL